MNRIGRLAAVAAVHTFGDYLFFHPHLHVLAADGLFDSEGRFHCMPADSRTPVSPDATAFSSGAFFAARFSADFFFAGMGEVIAWKYRKKKN